MGRLKPTAEGIQFYCNYLLKNYNKKKALLSKARNKADEEIKKLYDLRQKLVEKNLSGVFSDEIFKEQNAILEEKIIAAHAAKNDELIDKYDINAIIAFIKEKIANLPQTYASSNLVQLRSLLGSIFLSGFNWDYPGCSNTKISPLYQPIIDSSKAVVNDGGQDGITFELLTGMRL